MPEQRDATYYESGRATAPPGVCYTSLTGPTNKGYTHTVATSLAATNLPNQTRAGLIQSPHYTPNYTNFVDHRIQASPHYTAPYSPCPSPSPNYSSTIPKINSSNLPAQSPQYIPNYSTSSNTYHHNFSSPNISSPYNNSNYSNSTNNNSTGGCINTINNNNNNNIHNHNTNSHNFDYPSTSHPKNTPKNQQLSYPIQENSSYSALDQNSTNLFNYPKISKSTTSTPKYTPNYSNFSYFSNNQPKYNQDRETTDLYCERNSKVRKDFEANQKSQKTLKDDTEFNYNNYGDLQQLLSKHGTKIKSTTEANQDIVADSLFQYLQKKTHDKNPQDNFSCDLGDVSQLLVSLSSKYKSEEPSGLKRKENSDDSKLMNDFLTKIILEKEEKKFKSFEDKKKPVRKEIFDDFNDEIDEKKIKRDAMSHYQEDKNHQKKLSNYSEFNQWDYLNQQDSQPPNNHNRRGHFSFGGTSQPHSVGWNPVGMGMPRQSNPYYSNPHGPVMPAHAHSEYRYNHWNNPNHKNVPNIYNAHSQNASLPQTKMDMKHHGDFPNAVQDFGLSSPTSDYSKVRTSPRDMVVCNTPEKSTRAQHHSDHISSISPGIRNPSNMRTPPLPCHPKTVINNPLSDLQMLVTNQESEEPPEKPDNYQQESVDLSAHSDLSKQKENSVREEFKSASNSSNSEKKEFRSPVSVIQTQNKPVAPVVSVSNDLCEKPVELTSKSIDKSVDGEISSSISVNNLDNKCPVTENSLDSKKETVQKEVITVVKSIGEPQQTSVIVEKSGNKSVSTKDEELIPKPDDNLKTDEKQEENVDETDSSRKNKVKDSSVESSNKTNVSQTAGEAKTELCKVKDLKGSETSDSTQVSATPDNEGKGNEEDIKSGKRKMSYEEQVEGESKKQCLKEEESHLGKVVDRVVEENADLPTVSSTSAEVKPSPSEISKKTPKKKPSRKSRKVRLSSEQSSSSEILFLSKKSKSSKHKDDSRKKMKKSLVDIVDMRRGPFLHVEGSRDSPSTVTVINFPKGDDEDEKDKSAVKKQTANSTRAKHHNELDYRGKSKNGLFSSTLSARYDARTKDQTWICVFCKKGPHYNKLGDLFGPYIISKDESSSLCEFSGDEKDISDAQKRGGRNKKSLRSNNMVEHFQKMSKKLKKAQSNESCLIGMTVISDDNVDQLRYEVWVHEQCAIWSPNVCLIGSRIIGMQEAIWSSVKTMCSKCGALGANIGCVYRNCPNRSHYYCAKESGWSLEQESFISTCHVHKSRS